MAVYKIEDLGRKQLIKLKYNGLDKMYGEVSSDPPGANEKSLVILEGKKLDYKIFNKSRWLYYDRYTIHYIPKEFVSFFTTKETVRDIFLVFIKTK